MIPHAACCGILVHVRLGGYSVLVAAALGMVLGQGCGRVVVDSGSEGAGTGSTTTDDGGTSSGSGSSSSSGGGGTTTSSASSSGGGDTSTEGDTSSGGGDTSTGEQTSTEEATSTGSDTSSGSVIECDFWAQDCPEGYKCMPYSNDGGGGWNAHGCTPLDPDPKDLDEPCTAVGGHNSGVDDCKLGAMCWGVDPETDMGYCIGLCIGSIDAATCERPCDYCSVPGDAVVNLCLPICDPLAPGCHEGDTCVPGMETFVCVPDASGGEGAYGDPCEYVNVCNPGLVCANAASVPGCVGAFGCCTPFCDPAAPDPGCPDTDLGVECVPWFEEEYEPACVTHEAGCCVAL
jgi:hypothetical protein